MTPPAKPSGVAPTPDAAPMPAARSRANSPRRPATAEHLGPAGRAAIGKTARARLPLDSHAEFVTTGRSDPSSSWRARRSRVPELVPIRYGRMGASPYPFYRGGALVMAADLARTPSTGLVVRLGGDAHISNFGVYASPERRIVIDINDFDETHPRPF